MSEPTGQGDAPAAIGQLFDELGEQEFVSYPPLTRDELVSLGDAPLLRDVDDTQWWSGLDERTRDEVRATAQRGLLARGLVAIDRDDAQQLDISSRVRTVLALRRAPAFVTLVGNANHPSPGLRCYGLLGEGGRSAVLIEARVIDGVAEYLLCRPDYAATVVVRFLFAQPDESDPDAVPAPDELGSRMVRRRLELFPPGPPTGGRRYLAFAGTRAGALAAVDADGNQGPAEGVSEQSVVDLVRTHWAADASTAAGADGGST